MNIQEAKIEIKNTLLAYTGPGRFPTARQRPILLMGPPGIGKTAILEQIAQEMDVGLVAYAMTHHTRQSAVGLPHIETLTYGDATFSVTEYTMSEIVASIYQCMANTGKEKGILFLDEINCVSETLAPTMLQLLQSKTFGSHKIPDGWVIVAAGNPPAYNRSVREFDMATLDRVRLIPVEADLSVWMEYAAQQQVHSAILSWLCIKPDHFYLVEDTADGKFFVTARGWEDLSELLKHYEALNIPITKALVSQFLQKDEVASAFAAYYGLYRKYREDYQIPQILEGSCSPEQYARKIELAKHGGFEERFTVVRLLLDAMDSRFAAYEQRHSLLSQLRGVLENLRDRGGNVDAIMDERRKALQVKIKAELISPAEQELEQAVLDKLYTYSTDGKAARRDDFDWYRDCFEADLRLLEQRAQALLEQLDRGFRFAEDAFGQGQELVLLVSDLSRSSRAMSFISAYGCDAFLRHSDALLYRRREKELQAQCQALLD